MCVRVCMCVCGCTHTDWQQDASVQTLSEEHFAHRGTWAPCLISLSSNFRVLQTFFERKCVHQSIYRYAKSGIWVALKQNNKNAKPFYARIWRMPQPALCMALQSQTPVQIQEQLMTFLSLGLKSWPGKPDSAVWMDRGSLSGKHTWGDTGCASAGCAWQSWWQRLDQDCPLELPRPVLSAAEILWATNTILNALGVKLTFKNQVNLILKWFYLSIIFSISI